VAIEFNCPHCGKFLTTTESRALALAKCPSCNDLITVPATSEPAEASPAAASMRSPELAATAAWTNAPTPGPMAGPAGGFAPATGLPSGTSQSGGAPSTGPPLEARPTVEDSATVRTKAMESGAATSAPAGPASDSIARDPTAGATASLYCPRCGQPAVIGAAYCTACGLPLVPGSNPMHYAGFFRRGAAAVIDLALISLASGALALLVGRAGGQAWFLLWFFYSSALESSRDRATIGKRALGMIVCGADGRRLTFPRAAIRTVAKLASALICGMGFIMPLLTPKKQALHDLMTDAVVVAT
jgi:uncharacterized RDD family membrane protein YckC/phage FluMu protein Com